MKVITTVVGSLQTNCYLLIDEETKLAALIDPGDEAEKLLALVKSEGVTLKYILLTHGHRDHTLAVPALKKALPDVPVYIGEADAHSTGIYHYPMADLVPDLKYYGEGDTLPASVCMLRFCLTATAPSVRPAAVSRKRHPSTMPARSARRFFLRPIKTEPAKKRAANSNAPIPRMRILLPGFFPPSASSCMLLSRLP